MRTLALVWLAWLAGCHKTDPLYCVDHPDDTVTCGAAPDGGPIDAFSGVCFGPASAPFQVCITDMPTRDVLLPIVLDTDTDPFCLDAAHQPAAWKDATDACIVAAVTITSNSTTTSVRGKRPLVLLATQTISITQPLVAASVRTTGVLGPGANPTDCMGGSDGMFGVLGASGGGGGASFQTLGGAGGIGNSNTSPAGTPTATGTPSRLRGGCAGTNGGGPTGAVGAPGAGGGAIYLLAGVSITVSSTINASGAGAVAGLATSAGSGGGSGGMIALYAPMITSSTGMIFANGGGGAGGGDGSTAPSSGADPTLPLDQAGGGAKGGGGGGDGGRGYGNTTDATAGQSVSRSGGGGGGGAGYILANVAIGPMASPPRRGF